MCDTLIAAPEVTKNQFSLFAKNSDRPPNEAQFLDWVPARTYKPGDILKCTYVEIPQTQQTNALLLSRPFWMWGAEMGINEHGLVIGNEAVFSKIPANKEPALLGMDLLRLGLERAQTAVQAVEVIVKLLEEYGQGGNCVQDGHLYYHNSFLIADPTDSWVLETVDKQWFARQVKPIYSISNLLSLEDTWDRSSPGLEEFMVEKGLARDKDQINLSGDFSDLIYTTFADGKSRCSRSLDLMLRNMGKITVQSMAEILRDHEGNPDPTPGLAGADICMHTSLGPIRGSQTTGSMIASLQADKPLIFVTGTAAPCTGIFKPVWVDAPPDLGPQPTNKFDPRTTFWAHEELHREVIKNYPARAAVYQGERDELETEFIEGALALREGSLEERKAYSENCFQRAAAAEKDWLGQVRMVPEKQRLLHSLAWRGFNKEADIN
ncbi:MAG: C69 family dipeptidase [Anaerolineales bacterium]|nr:C69 family dipeptidase [Anaerolineales bacterium]